MPTVTWARVDPVRRAAVIEAAEAEFGAHGFSQGSLNVIARRAGVAKGSLFQYFADKRDLFAYIADVGSQRVRSYMEDRIRELDPSRPFFEFLTDLLDTWVAYFADHPQRPRTTRRIELRSRHRCPRQRADRDPSPLPGSPAAAGARRAHSRRPARGLRYRRVVVTAADDLSAYGAGAVRPRDGSHPRTRRTHPRAARTRRAQARRRPGGRILFQQPSPNDQGGQRMTMTRNALSLARRGWPELGQPAAQAVRRRQRQVLESRRHRLLARPRRLGRHSPT